LSKQLEVGSTSASRGRRGTVDADWVVAVTLAGAGGAPSARLVDKEQAVGAYARSGECEVFFAGALLDPEGLSEDTPGAQIESSDAEIVAAAYERLGPDLLQRLRGSFALLLWDRRRRHVLCARDQLGSHPLFYAELPGQILLSPSLEQLRSQPEVPSGLKRAALVDHLCHRWPDPGETLFESIRRVAVAHVLLVDRSGARVERYWELPTPEDWIEDDELHFFDALLEQAVRRQLELGAVGVYLSGGLDSVSVAAVATDLAARRGEPAPWALSLGFPHPDCDERDVQRSVAATLEVPQVLLSFDEAVGPQGLVGAGIELSAELPLPLVNPWRPAYVGLGREGRERGCDVILTGAGGDEWLTVNPFFMADLLRRGDLFGASRFASTLLRSYSRPRLPLLRFAVWQAGFEPLVLLAGRRTAQSVAPDLVRAKRRRDLRRLAPPWVAPSGELERQVVERIEQRIEQRMREPEPSGGYGFYFRGMDSPVLHPERSREQEEDFEVGRRLGLRIQHPYWDPDLVSFLCRVPPRLLLASGREKGLVRESTDRRFPGAGFTRQKKVTATTFYQARLAAEALSCWRELGGAPALATIGVIDEHLLENSMATISTSVGPSRLHQFCELMNLEAWVGRRV
jgi:asparagine synthetase B (glutamine-hydrolysing)